MKHYTSLITTSKKWRVASTDFYVQYATRDGKISFTTTEMFDILKASKITVTLLELLIQKKRLSFWNRIMGMDNDRLIKKVLFSHALEGKRTSGRPLLSWRQSITQDIKTFKLQGIIFTDDYPSNTVRGQSRLLKAFWLTDDEWKDDLRKKRDAKHRDFKLVLI